MSNDLPRKDSDSDTLLELSELRKELDIKNKELTLKSLAIRQLGNDTYREIEIKDTALSNTVLYSKIVSLLVSLVVGVGGIFVIAKESLALGSAFLGFAGAALGYSFGYQSKEEEEKEEKKVSDAYNLMISIETLSEEIEKKTNAEE